MPLAPLCLLVFGRFQQLWGDFINRSYGDII